jgi:hypothetical protein
LPIPNSVLNAVRNFYRSLNYEQYLGHCLSGTEIETISKFGIHPSLNFVLVGLCCVELRYTKTVSAGQREDLENGTKYMRLFGQERGPLAVYDPKSGRKLSVRPRFWAPANVSIDEQEQWFQCFRKHPPPKYMLRYLIVSMNYMDENYFELQEILPTLTETKREEYSKVAVELAIVLMLQYGVPELFIFHPSTEFKLGEVEEEIERSTDALVSPTEAQIIDAKYDKVRKAYSIPWRESGQMTLEGKINTEISFIEDQIVEIERIEPQKFIDKWFPETQAQE